eukprot:10410753-Alexandrium_andersonii.AAC.1
MSASLVGSEMCIRDRVSTSRDHWTSRPWPPSQSARNNARSTNSAKGHDPVSYTHLTLPTICSV